MVITKDWIYHSYMIFYFLALSCGIVVCLNAFSLYLVISKSTFLWPVLIVYYLYLFLFLALKGDISQT